MINPEIKQRLATAIERDGRSPRSISIACGFNPNFIGQMLLYDKAPGMERLARLCAELKVSLGWVLYGTEVTAEQERIARAFAELPEAQRRLLVEFFLETQRR